MKNLKGIFVVVLVVVALVIVGAVTYEAMIGAPRAAQQKDILKQYNFPGNAANNQKTTAGFPSANTGTASSGIDSTDADVNGALQDLNQIQDGSDSDLQTLETEIQGL